ncbi:MAG: hypothetical protein KBG39_03575 [Opitutaceae bacterium]|jgi:hypothetical protein|nr:hypothetical protein [Opitutaceae bacterium]MBP8962003.1 hypothetical protein [Opitutaceae bacterium]
MNARLYLRLLRPGRMLAVLAIYGWFVWAWLHFLFGLPDAAARFLALAVIIPALLGGFLIGPIHEAMHRTFFPLLPGARLALRRWHGIGLIVGGLALLALAIPLVPEHSPAALAGLIALSMTLPMLNRRRRIGLWHSYTLVLIGAGILLALAGYVPLAQLCHAAPWLVLAAALSGAALCFRAGFSDPFVRDRWHDPFLYCMQSTMPFVESDILNHVQAQARQHAAARSTAASRTWTVTRVGSSLREWVRVVHFARFGASSHLHTAAGLSITLLCIVPIFAVTTYLLALAASPNDHVTPAQFCAQLLSNATTGQLNSSDLVELIFVMPAVMACMTTAIFAQRAIAPAYTFPISRDRLAAVLFFETYRTVGTLLVIFLAGWLACYLAAALVAGQPFHLGLMARATASTLPVLPIASLTLALFLRVRRLLWRVPLFVGQVVGAPIVQVLFVKTCLDRAFTPLPLAIYTVVTALAVWLCWRAFRSHYRTCDAMQPAINLHALGIA